MKPHIKICNFAAAKIEPPALFTYLSADCHPIAIKSRRYPYEDRQFIQREVARLEEEDIIEPSNSPWRAQVLVVTNDRQKRRLVIDYSQTINRFTSLDAFPLPRINEIVNKIANY